MWNNIQDLALKRKIFIGLSLIAVGAIASTIVWIAIGTSKRGSGDEMLQNLHERQCEVRGWCN